ncbi:MAG: J domain-containing protein [Chthoniobacterales bacterium]
MSDPFKTLGVERRCYFTEEELKEAYHAQAKALHPDAVHGDTAEFVHLNTAYRKLLDPALRLRTLIDLEYPGQNGDTKSLPSRIDLFQTTARTLEEAKQWITKLKEVSSEIVRTSLLAECEEIISEIDSAQAAVEHWKRGLTKQLKELDVSRDKKEAISLSAVATDFAYADRWLKNLREQKFQLSAS